MMVNVKKHTSGVGVAATRTEKAAMIDKVTVKAVNCMFAILTLSFIHVSFYPLSIHALVNAHCHIEGSN